MIDPSAADLKACCAAAYGSEAARFLLGDSFHPGGTALTLEVAGLLQLSTGASVLDVAAGNGASAFALAETFGCRVAGVDLSASNVDAANGEAERRGLSSRVRFVVGDAEQLPVPAGAFDAVLCECAFCTFPDKGRAAAEFARVLRAGGRLGLSDLTRIAGPLPELDDLLAWIACIGDAQPLDRYADWLTGADFEIVATAGRDDALARMVDDIQGRLLFADVMIGLRQVPVPGLDVSQAKAFASAARRAVRAGRLGYGFVIAERPRP